MEPADDVVTLALAVDGDLLREVEQVIASRGWERDEGWRLLLACGLFYLQAESVLRRQQEGDLCAEDLAALSARCTEIESRLAALRMQAFEQRRALQDWRLSSGAIETAWRALPREAQRRDEELAALRAEVARLQAQIRE